jgi:hypothetical protein
MQSPVCCVVPTMKSLKKLQAPLSSSCYVALYLRLIRFPLKEGRVFFASFFFSSSAAPISNGFFLFIVVMDCD